MSSAFSHITDLPSVQLHTKEDQFFLRKRSLHNVEQPWSTQIR